MNVSSIALQGLQQAQSQVERTAQLVAGAGQSPTSGGGADSVNLSQTAVSLITAKNDFAANIGVLKVDDEMQKSVINLVG